MTIFSARRITESWLEKRKRGHSIVAGISRDVVRILSFRRAPFRCRILDVQRDLGFLLG